MDVRQGSGRLASCDSHPLSHRQNTLLYPDERQLMKGVKSTDVPSRLQSMVDSLVSESTRMQEGCGHLDRLSV